MRGSGIGVLAALVLVLAGCTGSSSGDTPTAGARPTAPVTVTPTALGADEGRLNLIARAGYAEDGSNDKNVDWVTPFTRNTGCKVSVKIASSSDQVIALMKTGQYDGVSAPGDAARQLIDSGAVAPVNTELVPSYATISGFLKDRSWNSVGKQMYGIPHGWAANLLMSRSDIVTPAPDSWAAVFDPDSPYKGRITAYDGPIYLADAALYLKTAKPELKITDPYELDQAQFAAAVDLLKQQHDLIGDYWSDYTKEVSAFESGHSVLGTSWPVIADLVDAGGKAKVDAIVPKEGSTGWSDTWMVSAGAKNPNCMYKWMDWITSPAVNAEVAEWFGEAPAQTLACGQTSDKKFCATYHATDAAYAARISFWTTPSRDCGDARGDVCQDYAAWAQAWSKVKN
jgi:putative spermidine/putrescine transport system substrate-binding protein